MVLSVAGGVIRYLLLVIRWALGFGCGYAALRKMVCGKPFYTNGVSHVVFKKGGGGRLVSCIYY